MDQNRASRNPTVVWLRAVAALRQAAWRRRHARLRTPSCERGICTPYASGVEDAVVTERHVRLFRNGRNQALRIPRDLELPGRAGTLRKRTPAPRG